MRTFLELPKQARLPAWLARRAAPASWPMTAGLFDEDGDILASHSSLANSRRPRRNSLSIGRSQSRPHSINSMRRRRSRSMPAAFATATLFALGNNASIPLDARKTAGAKPFQPMGSNLGRISSITPRSLTTTLLAPIALCRLKCSQLLFCLDNHLLQPRRGVRYATPPRSGSFHVNGAPVRGACSAQRICPKCPVPSCHREHRLEIRFEPSLAAGEYSVSNLRCSTYGPPRPQRALEVRRRRASSHRGRVRRALCPSMSRGSCDKRIEPRARAHIPGREN